jgi:Putative restriction endonuclease
MATETRATWSGVRPYRLTVRQYLAVLSAEILPERVHVELLGGSLVEKMTKYPPHNFVVGRLDRMLGRILPEPWFVSEEKPVKVGRFWYPEPDIAVIQGPDDLFEKETPNATDVGMLIEAAESSYALDRGKKWRRYASSRVPSYWIVNIPQRRIEVYSDPSGKGRSAAYRQGTNFGDGEAVPVILDGQEIGRLVVSDILPRP